MLEYEQQIYDELIHQDGLVVAAKGISMDTVLLKLFRSYALPNNLVIVINCSEVMEKYYTEKLNDISENIHVSRNNSQELVYDSGGLHFVTTRIFVIDLLKKRISIENITGIIILKAHTILETCQEAFCLRLYRQSNKTGFIKAFSNSAQSFLQGFGRVERLMRTVFLKDLYIWPRFHSAIKKSLMPYDIKTIEIDIPISSKMEKLQTHIMELMNLTAKELKKINLIADVQEVTVENCLLKSFIKSLQNQLDCVWHQLSPKSKQLIQELHVLRNLLVLLFYSDPITFYMKLLEYRTQEYALHSYWVFYEPAAALFTDSTSLVYSIGNEFNPEHCPKWKELCDIIKVELPQLTKAASRTQSNVLILCKDEKTAFQLNEILTSDAQSYLLLLAIQQKLKYKSLSKEYKEREDKIKFKFEEYTSKDEDRKRLKNIVIEPELNLKDVYILAMINKSKKETNYVLEEVESVEKAEDLGPLLTVIIRALRQGDAYVKLNDLLEKFRPHYIIMYQMDVTAVRQVEVYEAKMRQKFTTLYLLMHNHTIEEQGYLTSLRREKEAFEFLIKTKSTMTVPEDQDGKSNLCLNLQRDFKSQEVNTRHGGVPDDEEKRRFIIVDMREFRSELPSVIYKRGIDIEPVTITVGDYILSNEICVERKSISDLIGSLNSGRLYQQCTKMARCYAKPMLLIEFENTKPFTWQNQVDGYKEAVRGKLTLLTMHFRKLKILWSPNSYATAQLFDELKIGKDEPNVQHAISVSDQNLDFIESKFNSTVYDFVANLPGITSNNIYAFLRKYDDLECVLDATEADLLEVLGNANDAKLFYTALHNELETPTQVAVAQRKDKSRNKFKFVKNKKL